MDAAEPPLVLAELAERDGPAFLAAARASRHLHRPWVRPPRDVEGFFALLLRSRRDDHATYLAWRGPDPVAAVSLNDMVRGPLASAYLGYYVFHPFAGRGEMRRVLRLGLDRAFGAHGLHRLEADVRPANHRSRRLLQGLGFRHEPVAPRCLRVDGEWRDHERWALLADEW